MRMVFAQAVADDTRALAVRFVGGEAQLQHGVENASLHGLESVLHARKRALENDVLGIGHHGLMHDLVHVALDDFFQFELNGFFRHIVLPYRPSIMFACDKQKLIF